MNVSSTAKKLYRFYVDYKIGFDGNSPSLRDAARALRIGSPSTVSRYLDELVREGYISRHEGGMVSIVGGQWVPPDNVN